MVNENSKEINKVKEKTNKKKIELLKPKNDFVFQSLFNKDNEEITRSLVSALLDEKITDMKINDTKELYRINPKDKLGVLDLEIEVNNIEKVDIEIQLIDKENLVERLLFYFSRLYTMQIKREMDYAKAKRVVIIAIIDYELEITKKIKRMETIWRLTEHISKELELTDKIEIHIIELKKAKKEYNKDEKNKKSQWMIFLDDPNNEEVRKIVKENKDIEKATIEVIKLSEDEKMRKLAELREKAIMDEKAIYRAGLNKGIEQGIEQGKEQGIIKIVKTLKNKNYKIEEIIEITGLTKEEIENI